MLVRTPTPDLQDLAVLDEIHRIRDEVSDTLRTPRRWTGILRRNNQARAIRGSNSIEGIDVDLDDAVAAVEDEQPLTADERTFAEIQGYRMALGYVLATADDPAAGIDGSTIRTLHYMMLSHDLAAAPGRYRAGEIFVRDEESGNLVYTGPDPDRVPSLVTELVTSLAGPGSEDGFIDAAMAHLNLVMIHPFRDGNGRMARCLQTLVLGRRGVTEPLFFSIEEWLGHNTEDYDRILGVVGRGAWNPDSDAASWLKFCLRAHHMQAQNPAAANRLRRPARRSRHCRPGGEPASGAGVRRVVRGGGGAQGAPAAVHDCRHRPAHGHPRPDPVVGPEPAGGQGAGPGPLLPGVSGVLGVVALDPSGDGRDLRPLHGLHPPGARLGRGPARLSRAAP